MLFPAGGADAVQYGFEMVDFEAVMCKDMARQCIKIIAVGVDQLPAAGAFKVEMIAALACFLNILPAGCALLVDDVFAQDALVFQPFHTAVDRRGRDFVPVGTQLRHRLGGRSMDGGIFSEIIKDDFLLPCLITG